LDVVNKKFTNFVSRFTEEWKACRYNKNLFERNNQKRWSKASNISKKYIKLDRVVAGLLINFKYISNDLNSDSSDSN